MRAAEPGSVDRNRLAWSVKRDAERTDRLSRSMQTPFFERRGDENLGEIHDAEQALFTALLPPLEERACLPVVRIRAVERPDHDVCVEDDAQRSASSRSSLSR